VVDEKRDDEPVSVLDAVRRAHQNAHTADVAQTGRPGHFHGVQPVCHLVFEPQGLTRRIGRQGKVEMAQARLEIRLCRRLHGRMDISTLQGDGSGSA